MAGQSDAEIADRVGLDREVIEAHESLFYEVRTRLGSSDWVATFAIGPNIHEGLDPGDVETLWKAFAYYGGPWVLDGLLDSLYRESPGFAKSPPDSRLADLFRLVVEIMTLPVMSGNSLKVIELHFLGHTLEQEEVASGAASVSGPILVPVEVANRMETDHLGCAGCASIGEAAKLLAVLGASKTPDHRSRASW